MEIMISSHLGLHINSLHGNRCTEILGCARMSLSKAAGNGLEEWDSFPARLVGILLQYHFQDDQGSYVIRTWCLFSLLSFIEMGKNVSVLDLGAVFLF
jgi:hypothetical protein